MQIVLTLGILSVLASVGLMVVIMQQYKELANVEKDNDIVQEDFQKQFDRESNKELFKASMLKVLDQGKKALEDLEPIVTAVVTEMEKKKAENEACEKEKQTKIDELSGSEKEHTNTEVSQKSESDAWVQEITKLQEQLKRRSPICEYVKDKEAGQLCEVQH